MFVIEVDGIPMLLIEDLTNDGLKRAEAERLYIEKYSKVPIVTVVNRTRRKTGIPKYRDWLKEAQEINKMRDAEGRHSALDELLCEMLESLGHKAVVEEYHKKEKWYA